jgi:hypothetical protein
MRARGRTAVAGADAVARERAAHAQLSAADAANRCAVTNGVPAEQIIELNELLPLFRVVHSIPSVSTLLKWGGAQDNDAAALKARLAERFRGHPLTLFIDASDTKYCGRKKVTLVADATEPGAAACEVGGRLGVLRLGLPDRHGRLSTSISCGRRTLSASRWTTTAFMPRFERDAGF